MKIKFKNTSKLELYCSCCNWSVRDYENELNSIADEFNDKCPKCGDGSLFIR